MNLADTLSPVSAPVSARDRALISPCVFAFVRHARRGVPVTGAPLRPRYESGLQDAARHRHTGRMQPSGTSHSTIRPAAPDITIRPATQADFAHLLRMNTEWEHVTSPLDASALQRLHAQSLYHRIAESDGVPAAFLLAFGPRAAYESPNYRWFNARSADFCYIDRIVVDGRFQRKGLGHALYDDVAAFAAERKIARLTCEVDAEPFNAASDAFHARRGFVEVGTQWIGAKRVSLREQVLVRNPEGDRP